MKITLETTETQHPTPTLISLPPSDLSHKPRKHPHRKTKNSGAGVRLKTESSRRDTRLETPLLKWKFDGSNDRNNSAEEGRLSGEVGRRSGGPMASARKLGAGLWRLHLPKFPTNGGKRLGLQFEPSLQFSNSEMEGATKWDPVNGKTSGEFNQIFGQTKLLHQQASDAPVIPIVEKQLEQARARISELETERKSSKKKLEQFLQKLSEERAAWRSREHEKIRAVVDDMKAELSREKKNRQRLEIVNSKLVNELADAKLSAKCYMQEYEKERKARELIEEVCDELAKEIGEDRAEVETLKRESKKLCEEVEEERKMLQMAEVWREERVQMKLVDAKVMLEEKYSQMNRTIADLEAFMNSRSMLSDLEGMKKTEFLKEVAASVNIQDIRELKYEPPNPDDMFSVFEDIKFGESYEREVEPCTGCSPASQDYKIHTETPEAKLLNKCRRPNVFTDQSGELEKDSSEWESVSHPEDQGSSYSPDGSDPSSVNRSFRVSNVSREWERHGGDETPKMDGEVGSVQRPQFKKASSISRLWRTCPSSGDNYKIISVEGVIRKLSNGRLSNGAGMSPDCGSGKGGLSPQDLAGEWSPPDSGNPHTTQGMKGCIEWPRNMQKSSSKSQFPEAKMGNQKIQLRQVLKQKI